MGGSAPTSGSRITPASVSKEQTLAKRMIYESRSAHHGVIYTFQGGGVAVWGQERKRGRRFSVTCNESFGDMLTFRLRRCWPACCVLLRRAWRRCFLRRHNCTAGGAPSHNAAVPVFPYSPASPRRKRVENGAVATKIENTIIYAFSFFNRRADSTDVAITQISALRLCGSPLWMHRCSRENVPSPPPLLFGCQKRTRDNVTAA